MYVFCSVHECIIKPGFMIENKKWYAIYTRARWEKKVSDVLNRKGIANYCPLNKVMRQWSDRKKIVYEPLFTSYVFVNVSENDFLSIKKVSGVINMVYWLGKPAVIHDFEIETIKRFLNEFDNVKLQKTPINISDKVRILGGPLMAYEGQVLSVKSKTVRVALPSLGYMMYVEVDCVNVELIQSGQAIIRQTEDSYPMYAAK